MLPKPPRSAFPPQLVHAPGKIYVYLGSAAGLGSMASMSDLGDQEGDQFGYLAAGAGDVNGDGYGEVIGQQFPLPAISPPGTQDKAGLHSHSGIV